MGLRDRLDPTNAKNCDICAPVEPIIIHVKEFCSSFFSLFLHFFFSFPLKMSIFLIGKEILAC